MIKKARYSLVCEKATEFIKLNNIYSFPIDIFEIARQNDWTAYSYSELEKLGMPKSESKRLYGKDGSTSFDNGNYIILYNDDTSEIVNNRIPFNIVHEFAHIFLNHLKEFNPANLTAREYKFLENEANSFARNVLAPAEIVSQLNLNDPDILSDIFEITPSAGAARLGLLKNDLYYLSNIDKSTQRNLFHDFIHKKQCLKCGHGFVSEHAEYCPICGHNRLIRGDGKVVYNDGYELTPDGKALVCPRCDNEQTESDGNHCKICGVNLVNKCDDTNSYACGKIAEGNARYCEYCGAETTFSKQELLKDWKTAQREIRESEDFLGDIPFS